MLLKKPPEFWTNKPLGNPGRFSYVDQVVIGCRGDVIARHPRCYAREDVAEGMGLTSNLLHLRSLFSKGIQV